MFIIGKFSLKKYLNMLSKVKQALRKGYKVSDKFKLLIIAAYSSRPKFRLFTKHLVNSIITKDQKINIALKIPNGYINTSIRWEHFPSDYLSLTEIMIEDCYRILNSRKKYDLIIDGGGNTGLFTVLCNKVYKDVPILLFEPVEENIKIIKFHNNINNSNCKIFTGIISLSGGKRDLYIRNDNNSSFDSNQPYTSIQSVQSFNLPVELSRYNFESILIKLDIEGAEMEVIPDLLVNFPDKQLEIVGELHDWPINLHKIIKVTQDFDYSLETYNQDSICLLFKIFKITK